MEYEFVYINKNQNLSLVSLQQSTC